MEDIDLKRFWESIKEDLISSLPESVHPWVYSLEVSGYDNGVLTVVTGQAMARDWLKKNHHEQLINSLKAVSGEDNVSFNIIYDVNSAKKIKKETEKLQKKEQELELREKAIENLSYMQSSSNLNLKYKFENFVVGDNSKFAHAAALAVAKQPAEKYNPLFIYGSAGLGKTHLMQAIGHYILFNNPKLKVKYTKTEDYVNDFISNSRNSKDTIENMSKFNKKYTNIDVILIDDIQFIESKTKTMAQIQHTFDTLYNKGKQIVITSDRLPKDIPTLTAALSSRFEMGLMVELTQPSYETRLAIVEKLANNSGIVYEKKALEYVAAHFTNNVRELEGAFTKVCAYSEITQSDLTLELAKEILKCDENDKNISFEKIAQVTANYYKITLDDIKGSARGQKISTARHVAVYLSRELTNESFVKIAEFYNKKHTTIMFAHEKIKNELILNKDISSAVREIKQALKVF